MVHLGLIVIDIGTSNVSMGNKQIDKKIKKQREKEGCSSTRSTRSEGIKIDPSPKRHPILPPRMGSKSALVCLAQEFVRY